MIREVLREAAGHPWRTLADFAGLMLIVAAILALYVILWAMGAQPW